MPATRRPRRPTRSIAATSPRGRPGLSVAFDLPTQTGYDSDHELARGEVGKVGVPISHLGDMRTLFDEIPLEQMNTSMTINATAVAAGALYRGGGGAGRRCRQAAGHGAERHHQGIPVARDLYLPAEPSLKADRGRGGSCYTNVPKWNPMNVCSYHLQEAGATPEQELAFALATAIAVLDESSARRRAGGGLPDRFSSGASRSS
jgi:(2R)-ethylmalonyl-CoA mutase